jgi:hypothetical protein
MSDEGRKIALASMRVYQQAISRNLRDGNPASAAQCARKVAELATALAEDLEGQQ